ncbi:hypothetical protein [Halorussus caseinilyticus]|uniref:hypothetical protein n=1 Tax=Halorussus caseinilyticus TaxID=3034025 RepID=UPI0023E839BF|nr:hypothetical protein [Halorussus sp. DT72]
MSKEAVVGRLLTRTDDPELIADGGDNFVAIMRQADDIDPDVAKRLAKLERDDELTVAERKRLLQAYENERVDNEDLRRVSKLLDESNDEYLYDDDVSIDELLDSVDTADLDNVHLVVKDDEGDVRPLLQGHYDPDDNKKNRGWVYLKGRHIHGEQMDDPDKSATDFFPLGQNIKGRDLDPAEKMTESDIKKMVYKAIKNSETDRQDRIAYDLSSGLKSQTGVSRIRVVVRNGRVRQAYPKEGDAVHKWIQEVGMWKDELENQ